MGKLTDEIIAGAIIAPGKKSCALQDGGRLFLRVTPDGIKQWRLKYQVAPGAAGERMKTLGEYPAVGLDQARSAAAQIRATAKAPPPPLPPAVPPPAVLAAPTGALLPPSTDAPTFGTVAAHWATFDKEITPAALYRKRLHLAKFASLHAVPIDRVTVEQCIAIHDAIRAESGLHTATRSGLYLSCIFEHATRWRVIHNPAKDRKAWVGRSDKKTLAARRQDHITDRNAFGLLMERVDLWESPQGPTSSAFMRFIARVPVRASELAGARWVEFQHLEDDWLDAKALWTIPAERMKQREAHEMPLPKQAVAILLAQRAYVNKHYPAGSEYVFPHRDTGRKHVEGDNQKRTLNVLGYDGVHSVHGFRHSAMTIAVEAGRSEALWDRILAHTRKGVAARYNMAVQLQQRRVEIQWWADEIEVMKNGYTV